MLEAPVVKFKSALKSHYVVEISRSPFTILCFIIVSWFRHMKSRILLFIILTLILV